MKNEITIYLENMLEKSELSPIEFYIEAQKVINDICLEEISFYAMDLELYNNYLYKKVDEKDCDNCSKQIQNDNSPLPDKWGENNTEKDAKNALRFLEQYIQSSN